MQAFHKAKGLIPINFDRKGYTTGMQQEGIWQFRAFVDCHKITEVPALQKTVFITETKWIMLCLLI